MVKTKKRSKHSVGFWFSIGLIAQLAIAPNATVIRVLIGDIDPILFNVIRTALIATVSLPFVIVALRRFNRKNLFYVVIAGLLMAVNMISYVYALQYSQASYVGILSLASPIVLVILTHLFMKEKINFRAAAGVTVAAAGALMAVSLPLVMKSDAPLQFYPLATILIAITCICFPLVIILYRKANEHGLSLTSSQGLSSIVTFITITAVATVVHTPIDLSTITPGGWTGIIYSAIGVIFVGNLLVIASYRRIGSGATAALTYLGSIVSITIPVVVLGEQLSAIVMLGGALILVGVYLTEHHRSRHHYHSMRHH